MSAEEEARALAYRAQIERRATNRAALEAKLTAPEVHAERVREAWEPVVERTKAGEYEPIEEPIAGVANS